MAGLGKRVASSSDLQQIRDRVVLYTTSHAAETVSNRRIWRIVDSRWHFVVEDIRAGKFVQVLDRSVDSTQSIVFHYDQAHDTDGGLPYELGPNIDELIAFLDRRLLLDDLAEI